MNTATQNLEYDHKGIKGKDEMRLFINEGECYLMKNNEWNLGWDYKSHC